MHVSIETMVRTAAWVAAATVLAMVAIFVATGVGQDPLQFVHPIDEYRGLLMANPGALRATIALDNLFVVLYATVFVGVAVVLRRRGSARALVAAALVPLLATALLDLVENTHFLTLLAAAELGAAPSREAISFQVVESLLKFHLSYFGLFALGLALPRAGRLERTLSNLSIFVQLPIGILIYVTPPALAVPLVFARFTYFVGGLLMIAAIVGPSRSERAADSGARASLPGTMQGAAG